MRKLHESYQLWWRESFLDSQFDDLGSGFFVTLPWNVEVFGPNIHVGANVHMNTTRHQPIRLCTWPNGDDHGEIHIGDNVLISPDCRLLSARSITLEDNVMLGSSVLLSDSDWHEIYDRVAAPGDGAPIHVGRNAWIGERAIVCKGVKIGENSVIGAGSVVASDIEANVIAVGNPARPVKTLDPEKDIRTRASMFENPERLKSDTDALYKYLHRENTFGGWLKSKLRRTRED